MRILTAVLIVVVGTASFLGLKDGFTTSGKPPELGIISRTP